MPEMSNIYDYMRANANLLAKRILEEFPALHGFDDPISPRINTLLRRPFPAQTIAIMGMVKRWQQARTAMVVAECGTGKTLISLGAIHVHSDGHRQQSHLHLWTTSGIPIRQEAARAATCPGTGVAIQSLKRTARRLAIKSRVSRRE